MWSIRRKASDPSPGGGRRAVGGEAEGWEAAGVTGGAESVRTDDNVVVGWAKAWWSGGKRAICGVMWSYVELCTESSQK